MQQVAIISFNKTVTTLGQQFWPVVDALWPTVGCNVKKVKVKITLELGMTAQRGRRVSALLFRYGYIYDMIL